MNIYLIDMIVTMVTRTTSMVGIPTGILGEGGTFQNQDHSYRETFSLIYTLTRNVVNLIQIILIVTI